MQLPFSAHLGYLFLDLPLARRFDAARAAGFEAVEHPAPFALAATDLRDLLDANGLRMAQITSGMGNAGEKGIACLPGREAEFRDGYARALDYAETIDCPFVHPMAGVGGNDLTYRANIEVAVRLAEGRKAGVLVEAISHATVSGYHMAHINDVLALARSFPMQIRVLIDTFHATADGHGPAATITAAGPHLGHVHIADFPGRHEPMTGSTDFASIFNALADLRFGGAIGFEYLPSEANHLTWLPAWRDLRAAAVRLCANGDTQ
jgi:2-dehydrotetronate isomerase